MTVALKTGTYVSDVTLLRLEFDYDGEVYNLGVVSNTQSGSNKPSNKDKDDIFNLFEWLEDKTGAPKWVWIMIAIAIPLAILLPVLSIFFPAFRAILVNYLQGHEYGLSYCLSRA